jgi:hypothetical protein
VITVQIAINYGLFRIYKNPRFTPLSLPFSYSALPDPSEFLTPLTIPRQVWNTSRL